MSDAYVRWYRFIPASAGNAPGVTSRHAAGTVHPRECGERVLSAMNRSAPTGSSPRVRGTLAGVVAAAHRHRFIPASAGNAGLVAHHVRHPPVHPRECGERASPTRTRCRVSGSSPRVRGTQMEIDEVSRFERFIPASAGNAAARCAPPAAAPVHPRECGERVFDAFGRCGVAGSSPRVRGTRPRPARAPRGGRFIPASAGNAEYEKAVKNIRPVHPRECGERICTARSASKPSGSSPRVRGTRERRRDVEGGVRFIPASAGNAEELQLRGDLARVHPRECGERLW